MGLPSGTKIRMIVWWGVLICTYKALLGLVFHSHICIQKTKSPHMLEFYNTLCSSCLHPAALSFADTSPCNTLQRHLKVSELNSGSILGAKKIRDHWTVTLLLNHCLYLHIYTTFTICDLPESNSFCDMCCWFLGYWDSFFWKNLNRQFSNFNKIF